MSLVILEHRLGKRLKINNASRRGSPRTRLTTLRRAATLGHDTRTTRDANLFLLQCISLSEFCERSLGVVWCTNRELTDVLRLDLTVHLLIDRNRNVVRVPLDGILQLIRLRSRTLARRLLRSEQRPPARVVERRLVIRLTPVLLHLQPGEIVVHLRKKSVANCQLDVAVHANVRNDEVDTRLRLLLTGVEGRLRLLHHEDIGDVLDLNIACCLGHVCLHEGDCHCLRVLVVLNMPVIQEVKIHTERTDSGHLLRDGQRTTI